MKLKKENPAGCAGEGRRVAIVGVEESTNSTEGRAVPYIALSVYTLLTHSTAFSVYTSFYRLEKSTKRLHMVLVLPCHRCFCDLRIAAILSIIL